MTSYTGDRYARPWVRLIARVASYVWRWSQDIVGLRPMLGRMTAHASIVVTLLVVSAIAGLRAQSARSIYEVVDVVLSKSLAQNTNDHAAMVLASASAGPSFSSRSQITRQANAHTAIPERPRLTVITYVVQPGDTPESIAEFFALQPTTLLWSNPEMEKMPDLLQVGQVLTILPIDGVYHTVVEGDTLESIAETYRVEVSAVVECPFNSLPRDGNLEPGTHLIVPGGSKPYETRKVTTYTGPAPDDAVGTGRFRWPAFGTLTQGYWYGHRAIDIGAAVGTAIMASDDGFVSFAGWTDIGYGYLVVVDHANGYQTYYAHLSNVYVTEGQTVSTGDVIGAMGSTGNSTGPHLHFEIRYNGYPTNPLIFLSRR